MIPVLSSGRSALGALLLLPLSATAQTLMPDSTALRQLRNDVYTLADDSMQGRELGTKGEQMAAGLLDGPLPVARLGPQG
jgi:hypothetical protein